MQTHNQSNDTPTPNEDELLDAWRTSVTISRKSQPKLVAAFEQVAYEEINLLALHC